MDTNGSPEFFDDRREWRREFLGDFLRRLDEGTLRPEDFVHENGEPLTPEQMDALIIVISELRMRP
jgi:hypothetical protein